MKSKMFHGYKVQEDGNIWKKDGSGFLRPAYTHKGYQHVGLYIEGKLRTMTVHRIVTLVFLGVRHEGHEVNHKNGIRDDNRLCNLEYLTKSQNNQLSYDSGRRVVSGEKNANAKLTEEQVRAVCERLVKGDYPSRAALGRELGISKHTIHAIVRRIQWTCVSKDYSF